MLLDLLLLGCGNDGIVCRMVAPATARRGLLRVLRRLLLGNRLLSRRLLGSIDLRLPAPPPMLASRSLAGFLHGPLGLGGLGL